MRSLARFAVLALVSVAIAHPVGQGADPRLTVSDVEKVTGIKGLQIVAPGAVTGAGAGLNFAGPDPSRFPEAASVIGQAIAKQLR